MIALVLPGYNHAPVLRQYFKHMEVEMIKGHLIIDSTGEVCYLFNNLVGVVAEESDTKSVVDC